VTVEIFDAYNNPVTSDNTDSVSLAIGNNTGAGTLGGTTSATVSNGVATFANLSINKTGAGYTPQGHVWFAGGGDFGSLRDHARARPANWPLANSRPTLPPAAPLTPQ
jgi:hypothetical protein